MTVREMHQSNRVAWNEAAAHYAEDLEGRIQFLRAGGMNFCAAEEPYLRGLGDWCRRAVHLQCAGGTDTLSLWNKGVQEVVGVDISEDMIAVARQKSDALNAPASWFCCDILDLDPVYGDYFQTAAQMEQGWGPTYIGELAKPKEDLSRKYESQKTFGQIINPLVQAGLRLEKLEEHAEPYWDQFPNLPPEVVAKLPNTFSLLMRKD